MPDQRRKDAVAKHHYARDDADQADFHAANVCRLLRVVAVQKAPKKRGHNNGNPPRTSEAREKWDRKQSKRELFVHRRKQTNRHSRDPREPGIHRVGIIYFLRRPRPEPRRDCIKDHDETDVRGGKRNAHYCRREEFLRTDAAPCQELGKSEITGLRLPVEWLRGRQAERYDRNSQSAQDLHEQKSAIRVLRIVI